MTIFILIILGVFLIFTPKNMITFLFAGDFNPEEKLSFLNILWNCMTLKNLVEEKICFKLVENPSCVDAFSHQLY